MPYSKIGVYLIESQDLLLSGRNEHKSREIKDRSQSKEEEMKL